MHVKRTETHAVWDRSLAPLAVIAPGSEITVDTADASDGQVTEGSVAADIPGLDFSRVNPVTGPFAIEGAQPGDALVIDILDVSVGSWGWTANIPGFGLLAEDFPDPYLRISTIADGRAELLPGVSVPVVPMIGTIGVAPPEPGPHPMVPPSRWGGNLDIRHIGPGARLVLPVGVPGACCPWATPTPRWGMARWRARAWRRRRPYGCGWICAGTRPRPRRSWRRTHVRSERARRWRRRA